MLRGALLSIVLTVATGQNAALFCGIWCHSDEGTASGCEHHAEATSPDAIANDAHCAVNGAAIVFMSQDARRSTSAPTDESAVLVPAIAFTPPAVGIGSAYAPGNRLLLELRPLVLPLRI